MSVEKIIYQEIDSKNLVHLPNSFERELLVWPELKTLLESFAYRDRGTFMHSVAVHFAAERLAKDLFLLLKPSLKIQNDFFKLAPFWLLHDIGKVAADKDSEIAQKLVHPHHLTKRPSYDRARHWIHPQMGSDMLEIWANFTGPRIKPFVQKWAQLTYLHDFKLNKYLEFGDQKVGWAEKLALLIFSISDTSMAMGLPRPNKKCIYNDVQIRQILHKNHLQESRLKEVFPGLDLTNLSHFIVISILNSLNYLQNNYHDSTWVAPTGFTNPKFGLNLKTDQQKTKIIDDLVANSWQERERRWDATMVKMDLNHLFSRSNGS